MIEYIINSQLGGLYMGGLSSLTPLEVSELLKITKNTVYELIKRGELPAYKIGKKLRIDVVDVENYINAQKTTKVSLQGVNNDSYNHNTENKPTNLLKTIDNNKDKIIISGQDVILDILARHIENSIEGVSILRSYIGSYNGLYEFYNGRISIASTHLWYGDSDEYNLPYIRTLVPGVPCTLINLAYRKLGFYVKSGNPKNLTCFQDLTRGNISFINREKGCGVRILLDEKLRVLNLNPREINGYEREELSHLSVASAVARGDGDVGIGNEKTALQVTNIDFVPLQVERYDLVIKQQDLTNPVFRKIIAIIKSVELRNEISGLGGYDLKDLGKFFT